MAEDEIVGLLWKNGQLVRQRQTQRPTSDGPSPPLILHGSGSGGGGIENAPLPQPLLPLQPSDQNLFIQEDEMASWLHHPYFEDYFRSDLLYSGVDSTPASSVSLAPPPPPTTTQTIRPNFMNFSRIIGRAGPSMPVARASTQVDSTATPSSSATESCLTPATESPWTAHGFPIPGLNRKGKAAAVEIAGTPKAETEPIQIQPPATPSSSATESCPTPATESPWTAHGFPIPGLNRKGKAVAVEIAGTLADDRKRKEKVETIDETEKNKEARGSTSRKRSRAAEMHNIAERRRREKINAKMKDLQQLLPRCNKSDKVSMLDDAIDFVKSLQLQIEMMSTGGGVIPMMYPSNMQRFVPHMAMGMDRPPLIPFPRRAHMAGVGPSYPAPRYPFQNIQTSDPSRVHLPPTQQLNPVLNQPQFMGLHQMQPPPPLQNQTSQLSFSQASSSKQSEDQENQPKG